ncbi:hypothetical protein NUW54_g13996 [Trametes sanguinea]|uniref:Uncharacterized protein n=1 Tax=Trametes sanguinea TaxID=158606 RepID=A0ACC1MHQ2_9APHY|nr:hypothetical protein NUW54_g13996 [Trametes sanguinea]
MHACTHARTQDVHDLLKTCEILTTLTLPLVSSSAVSLVPKFLSGSSAAENDMRLRFAAEYMFVTDPGTQARLRDGAGVEHDGPAIALLALLSMRRPSISQLAVLSTVLLLRVRESSEGWSCGGGCGRRARQQGGARVAAFTAVSLPLKYRLVRTTK